MIFIGLCHKCHESNVQTELVNGSPLCLKCKVVKELKNELKNESDAKKWLILNHAQNARKEMDIIGIGVTLVTVKGMQNVRVVEQNSNDFLE